MRFRRLALQAVAFAGMVYLFGEVVPSFAAYLG